MISKQISIINKLGLHARAAAKLVNVASRFKSHIHITKDEQRINGKSIMGVMMLAAGKGSCITVDIEGEDQTAAMQAIEQLIEERFGEEE